MVNGNIKCRFWLINCKKPFHTKLRVFTELSLLCNNKYRPKYWPKCLWSWRYIARTYYNLDHWVTVVSPIEFPPPLDGEPNFRELYSHVISQVATKWMQIGVELLIPQNVLDQIGHDYTFAIHQCRAVFTEWKNRQTRPFVWGTVIQVLQCSFVGEAALAENLRRYLCTDLSYT